MVLDSPIECEGRDLLSELPADVIDRVLEHLSTRDAARTALLSTQWRDAWLRHGRLVFDYTFFRECLGNCKGDRSIAMVDIITKILQQRLGPVKKFMLYIYHDPYPRWSDGDWLQSDIDWWCHFLVRNGVEQLTICSSVFRFKLPVCLFSCPTIKQLKLSNFIVCCPVNAPSVFPGVTSLTLLGVVFRHCVNRIVPSLPNLEELAFCNCFGINAISSGPKLVSILACGCLDEAGWRWFMRHCASTKILCLKTNMVSNIPDAIASTSMFSAGTNLEVIKLYDLCLADAKQLIFVMLLLRKSPKLYELEIIQTDDDLYDSDDEELGSIILKDPDFVSMDLKMLNTLKIESFYGSKLEMSFVKMLLAISPALDRVVIRTSKYMGSPQIFDATEELWRSPRASQQAEIVVEENMPDNSFQADFLALYNMF